MDNLYFYDKENNELDIKLILSFTCPDTKKNYVIIDNQEKIFNKFSNYNNLDIFEITSHSGNDIKIQKIPDEEWPVVQNFVFNTICNRIIES